MKLNKLPYVNIVILLLIVVFLIVSHLKSNKKEEVVYINNIELFNGFNMTKDMKSFGNNEVKKRTTELESLYTKFNALTEKEKKEKSSASLQQQIAIKSKELQEFKEKHGLELNQKIWLRLNTYIKEYAESNNLKVVLGSNGSGSLMFAEESIDFTNKILHYSNKKYEGK